MATSPLFGWEEPDDVDLVKDGAAAIRTLGNAIDTSMGDLLGGTTGQVLSKASNTNMDFTWVTSDDANAIQNAIVDAKGDLIAATAADTPARLAVGTNGQVLTADSTAATGLAWATASSGGMTLISTTSLSGASTTVSFGSTYTNLMFVFYEMTNNTADGAVTCYFNSGSGNNSGVYTTGSTSTSYNDTTIRLSANQTLNRANSVNAMTLIVTTYNPPSTTYYQPFQVFGGWYQGARQNVNAGGHIHIGAALTSLTVSNSGGTFSGGKVALYGVK